MAFGHDHADLSDLTSKEITCVLELMVIFGLGPKYGIQKWP